MSITNLNRFALVTLFWKEATLAFVCFFDLSACSTVIQRYEPNLVLLLVALPSDRMLQKKQQDRVFSTTLSASAFQPQRCYLSANFTWKQQHLMPSEKAQQF